MWRFLPPAFLMVGAFVVLVAGAIGDVNWWTDQSFDMPRLRSVLNAGASMTADLWDAATGRVRSWPRLLPAPAPTAPTAVALVPPAPPPFTASTALPGQVIELESKIAQQKTQITLLTADAEKARQELEALRERQAEPVGAASKSTELESQIAQQKQEIASLTADAEKAHQELDTLRTQRQAQPAPAVVPKPTAVPTATHHPRPQPEASRAPQEEPSISPRERLVTARQALLAGRGDQARSLLETAQLQFVFSPADPNVAETKTISMPATWIGRALRSLQAGDVSGALHNIDLAINSS